MRDFGSMDKEEFVALMRKKYPPQILRIRTCLHGYKNLQ